MIRKPIKTNVDEFIMGAKDLQSSKVKKNTKQKTDLKRQTYYITPVLIKALSLMYAFEGIDKSEIVRAALAQYIPEKYINQAKEMSGDLDQS